MAESNQHIDIMEELELVRKLHGGLDSSEEDGTGSAAQAAFKIIYDRLYHSLYWFGIKYLRDEAEVEDVLSETFLQVWTKRAEFTSVQSIHMFLHVVVKNRCLDILRRREMKTHKHAEILLTLEAQEPKDFFLEQVENELMRKIYEQVHQLPSQLREVFMLSYEEGLKPAQIAERLSLSVQTIKNRKVTALKVLKAALSHEPLVIALLVLMEYDGQFFG